MRREVFVELGAHLEWKKCNGFDFFDFFFFFDFDFVARLRHLERNDLEVPEEGLQ